MKRLTAAILVCTLIGTAAPAAEYTVSSNFTAYASESYTDVTDNDIKYRVYSDHAEILYYEDNSITTSEIPSQINGVPVTVINAFAFASLDELISVTIPASITEINAWAFDDCTSLTQINTAKENPSYCSVGGILFTKDMKTLVKYPAGLSGTEYTIPEEVKVIGDSSFHTNVNLKNVVIPDSVDTIQEYAFCNALKLEKINIPDSVKTIGTSAFEHCISLTEARLPESLEIIEKYTFSSCQSLRNISLPDSVTEIRAAAFRSCYSLKNVIIPKNINIIKDAAFWDCTELDNITFLNPDCGIGEYSNNVISNGYEEVFIEGKYTLDGYYNGIISGYIGSTAEEYAEVINCKFRAIDNIGDVNLDGAVDSSDASLVLAEYAASATGSSSVIDDTARLNADVNFDETADALDASKILSYYAYTATGGTNPIEDFLA